MSNHLSMRSGNPALQASTFKKHLTSSVESKMTLSGTVNKTGISLLLVIISAGYTWGNPGMHIMMIPAGIVGLILALATVFKPTIGHITVPAYAVAQGILLGVISMYFNAMYPGIVVQAVFLTFGTLGALLLAYKSGLIAATENFKLGIAAATGGIAILYLINFIIYYMLRPPRRQQPFEAARCGGRPRTSVGAREESLVSQMLTGVRCTRVTPRALRCDLCLWAWIEA